MAKSLTDIAAEIFENNFLRHRNEIFCDNQHYGYLAFASSFRESLERAHQWQEAVPAVAATLQRLQPNDPKGIQVTYEIMLLVIKLASAAEGKLEGEAARVTAEKRMGDYLEEYAMTSQDAHDQVTMLIANLKGKGK
jgi:hypothetical protein